MFRTQGRGGKMLGCVTGQNGHFLVWNTSLFYSQIIKKVNALNMFKKAIMRQR